MRFLLDENFPLWLQRELRARGNAAVLSYSESRPVERLLEIPPDGRLVPWEVRERTDRE